MANDSKSMSTSGSKKDSLTNTGEKKNLSFKLTKSKSKRHSATLDLVKTPNYNNNHTLPRDPKDYCYSQLNEMNAGKPSPKTVLTSNLAASALSSLPTSHAIPNVISLPRGGKASVVKMSKKKKNLIKKGLTPSKNDEILFGVLLDQTILRDPSHDGIPLPAFLRYAFDYVENYGLYLEGIYRVPGVKSQLQSMVNYLNRGVAFPNLPPTSATYLNKQFTNISNQTYKSSKSSDGNKTNFEFKESSTSSPSVSIQQTHHRSSSMAYSDKNNCEKTPPHDPYVIACLIKFFFRSLPKDSFLSKSLRDACEAACDLGSKREAMEKIGLLIHSQLQRSQKYLLAWTLQNLMRVVNFSGNNLMNLQNLVTVMAPCLGFSHRLLEILLTPDHHDNKFIAITGWDTESENSSYESWQNHDPTASTIQVPHWLFPDKAFRYRPYVPPLLPMNFISDNKTLVLKSLSVDAFIEQVEEIEELNQELSKQLSLLSWIQLTLAKDGKIDKIKENFLWEVQRVVTQMKRKKALLDLTDPELIKNEITRIQNQLDKFYDVVGTERDVLSSQNSSVSSVSMIKNDTVNNNKVLEAESEIWCLQRTITLLKRRLRYYEKLNELVKEAENVDISDSNPENLQRDPHQSFGSHILNPTPLENIDEEEVLNLTLRKLPFEQMKSRLVDKSLKHTSQQKVSEKSSDSIIIDEIQMEDRPVTQVPMIHPDDLPLDPIILETIPSRNKIDLPIVPPRPKQSPSNEKENILRDQTRSLGQNGSAFKPIPMSTSNIRPKTLYQNDPENKKLVKLESRFLELLTLNTDLKQRVHAEREEIDRIKSQIQEMLRSGQGHARKYYANHLAMGKLLRQSSCLKSLDKLTNIDGTLSSKLIDKNELLEWDLNHESNVNPYSKLVNERVNEEDNNSGLSNGSKINNNDIDGDNEDDLDNMMSLSEESDFDEDDDEDDEEEDADIEGSSLSNSNHENSGKKSYIVDEYELAAQLHQLVKDNVELENLNSEYLKKIQEERSKCSEIKVLIKANQR